MWSHFKLVFPDLFGIFDLWAPWGAENGPRRVLKAGAGIAGIALCRPIPADAGIAGKLGATPSLLSADAGIAGASHLERLVHLCCAGCYQSCLERQAPANGAEP